VLHLFNSGEHYWLDNAEIATLIKENEPYQKLNDLVEMIGETFRKPKPTEQERWWTLPEIHELLKERFTNYDPKTSYEKLGRALSNQQFDFESDRKTSGHVYKIVER
jgi:transcription termination factor Rho